MATLLETLEAEGIVVGQGSAPMGGIAVGLGYPVINEYVTLTDDKDGKGRAFFIEIAKKSMVVTHRDLMDAIKTDRESGKKVVVDTEEYLTAWQGQKFRIVVDGE